MFKWKKQDSKAPSKRADFIVCWIKDLIDENTKQTRNTLKDDKGMCCLGVATNRAGFKWEKDDSTVVYKAVDNKCIYEDTLPKPLEKFLKTHDGVCSFGGDNRSCLTYLNDTNKNSFREIAKVIQDRCETIFLKLSKKEVKYIKGFKILTRQEMRDKKKAA